MDAHDQMILELSMLRPRFFKIHVYGRMGDALVFCAICQHSRLVPQFTGGIDPKANPNGGRRRSDVELRDEGEKHIKHAPDCLGPLTLAAEAARIELRFQRTEGSTRATTPRLDRDG